MPFIQEQIWQEQSLNNQYNIVLQGVHLTVAQFPTASQNSVGQVKTVSCVACPIPNISTVIVYYILKCKWLNIRVHKVFFYFFSTGFQHHETQLWVTQDIIATTFPRLLNSLNQFRMPRLVLLVYSGNVEHIQIFLGSIRTPRPCLSLVTIGTTGHILLCCVLQKYLVLEPEVFRSYIVLEHFNFLLNIPNLLCQAPSCHC